MLLLQPSLKIGDGLIGHFRFVGVSDVQLLAQVGVYGVLIIELGMLGSFDLHRKGSAYLFYAFVCVSPVGCSCGLAEGEND